MNKKQKMNAKVVMNHVNMMIKETPRVNNVLSSNVSKSDQLVIISFPSKLSSFIEKKWGKRIEEV